MENKVIIDQNPIFITGKGFLREEMFTAKIPNSIKM